MADTGDEDVEDAELAEEFEAGWDGLLGLHEAVVGDALDDEGEVVDGEGGGENEEEGGGEPEAVGFDVCEELAGEGHGFCSSCCLRFCWAWSWA